MPLTPLSVRTNVFSERRRRGGEREKKGDASVLISLFSDRGDGRNGQLKIWTELWGSLPQKRQMELVIRPILTR